MPFRIYKYVLELAEVQAVTMPEDAEILKVGEMNGDICVWVRFEVINQAQQGQRRFKIIGTGDVYDESGIYLDSIIARSGYVWHIFDMGKPTQ